MAPKNMFSGELAGLGISLTISKAAYQKALKKVNASKRVWKKHGSHSRSGSSLDTTKYKDPATNRNRAVVEVYRFQNQKRAKPFVGYMKGEGVGAKVPNFVGHRVCTVERRVGKSVTAKCIDGRKYTGRSNVSGMWIKMRPKKGR